MNWGIGAPILLWLVALLLFAALAREFQIRSLPRAWKWTGITLAVLAAAYVGGLTVANGHVAQSVPLALVAAALALEFTYDERWRWQLMLSRDNPLPRAGLVAIATVVAFGMATVLCVSLSNA